MRNEWALSYIDILLLSDTVELHWYVVGGSSLIITGDFERDMPGFKPGPARLTSTLPTELYEYGLVLCPQCYIPDLLHCNIELPSHSARTILQYWAWQSWSRHARVFTKNINSFTWILKHYQYGPSVYYVISFRVQRGFSCCKMFINCLPPSNIWMVTNGGGVSEHFNSISHKR